MNDPGKCAASPANLGQRVGFFGGSFDPPHFGHLAIARAACAALHLDTVLFAPVGAQPLKPRGSSASFQDRVAMTRLAIAGECYFSLSLADAPRPGGAPNYTVDSLKKLESALLPGSELFCLLGADSFLALSRWHRAAEIPFVAPLIVASRPGERLDSLESALPAGLSIEADPDTEFRVPSTRLYTYRIKSESGESAPFYLLPDLEVEISASAIRGEMADGAHAGSAVLPDSVREYIRAHDLYRPPSLAPAST